MQKTANIRQYNLSDSIVFLKTKEAFGGLSNMASGYPLLVNSVRILSTEALYQACRFPHLPQVQRLIIQQTSPMTAKMVSKPYRVQSRPDWDRVRVKIMRWCLRVKLAQNRQSFGKLLLETGDLPIVEKSFKDEYWGAKPTNTGILIGMNVLGRLLMELREELKSGKFDSQKLLEPPTIIDFLLDGKSIEPITIHQKAFTLSAQPSLFEPMPTVEPKTISTPTLRPIPQYETYKDSGIEWLDKIPAHWQAIKMKYLFRDVSIKNKPNETLLSVTQDKGVVPRDWVENRMVMPSGNLESFKFIKKGDFAISLRSFEGGLEYCHHDGIVSPAYTVLKSSKPFLLDGYYRYLFKSHIFISELQTSIVGIREGKNISYDELRYSILPIPKESEQTAIAHFLDQKTAQIDAAIAIKEKQIALLKERKQILIQQAVTQGLDPTVPMKDSGVEWIGKIPAHWEVKKAKYLFRMIMESSEKKNNHELLSVYTDIGVKPRRELEERGNKASTTDGYWFVKKGDIVVNKLLAWMGAIGLSEYDGVTSPAYDILRPKVEMNGYFYHFLFRSDFCSSELKRHSRGIMDMRLRLYFDRFGLISVPYPPPTEQIKIVEFIESQSDKIDEAVMLQQQQIEKLREYKTTLINSAVTGKIRVTPEMVATA